ncbi:MAG: 23S rRNA (adenine(2503)-C(2))-methyltransferase RlmN [bacterium]|nr:23S rRNA (adenine(2503)-C(2))-methyltransferase RlmN [bacterium]
MFEEILKKESSFRLKQAKKAVFQDLIENWDKVTTLPQNLRQKLQENCPIQELRKERILVSKDNQTNKVLFELKDGFKIESILMRHEDGRNTVCVSSQVGCTMNCQFCATGQQGFKRNLSSSEIVEQILFFARILKKTGTKITNVVFMGMGEPFLNYDNVLGTIKILNDKDGFNLGARHISISTCGIVGGIKKLSGEKLQVNLAISLNASNNELRSKLMPINKIYSIEKILAAVDDHIKKTRRRVMFEYLMIDGVNDSLEQVKELAKLLKKPLCFANLISYNPIGHSRFKPSPGWKIKKFKEILEKAKIPVTQRYRFGREIKAACGQLAGTDNL